MAELSSKGPISRQKRKIITEKKRRRKINHHLSELKTLLLEIMNTQMSAQTMKLEHSEVLEMAVDFFKSPHKGLSPFGMTDRHAVTKPMRNALYNTGYAACATEVTRFLSLANVKNDVKENIESFLSSEVKTCDRSRQVPNKTVRNTPYDRTNTYIQSAGNIACPSAVNRCGLMASLNPTSVNTRCSMNMQQTNVGQSSHSVPSVNDPPFYDIVSAMFGRKSG